MTSARVILFFVTVSSLVSQPLIGQKRKVELRGGIGYTLGLEDTPPHAWLGGGAVTAAARPHFRVGVEILHAHMFGKIRYNKRCALLVTPVVEYEFMPHRRINPYLVVGFGFTQYRGTRRGQSRSRTGSREFPCASITLSFSSRIVSHAASISCTAPPIDASTPRRHP